MNLIVLFSISFLIFINYIFDFFLNVKYSKLLNLISEQIIISNTLARLENLNLRLKYFDGIILNKSLQQKLNAVEDQLIEKLIILRNGN
jgi:hypothetical protein